LGYPCWGKQILDYGGECRKKEGGGEQINLSSNPKSKIERARVAKLIRASGHSNALLPE